MSFIFEYPVLARPLTNLITHTPPLLLLHSRVLITTDVWARGIDVQQVSLVINYDLPSYVFLVRLFYGGLEPYRAAAWYVEIVKITFTALVDLVDLEGRVSP